MKKPKNQFFKFYSLLPVMILMAFSMIPVLQHYQETRAATSTYNFVGITSPSGTHVAREFEVDVDFPTVASATIDTLTDDGTNSGTPEIRTGIAGWGNDSEASNALYTAIASSDDSRWTTADPGFGDTSVFWAQFDIAETPANVTQIDVKIEGFQGGSPQAGRLGWLGIWNLDRLGGPPAPHWETLTTSQQTSDFDYTGSVTTNLTDYIDDSGKLTIVLYNEDQSDSLQIDFVEVVVTFNATVAPPAILTAVADDPDNGNRTLNTGDTLTLTFDKGTNAPAVSNKTEIDGLINFGGSFGANYTGAWSTTTFTDDTLTLTVTGDHPLPPPTPPDPLDIGESVTIIADGTEDLKDTLETSIGSTSAQTVTGNWGIRPDDDIMYASNSDSGAKIYEVDLTNANLTYVGELTIPTFAIARRPSDGFIIGAENGAADGDLAFLNPDTGANGTIGAIGPDTNTNSVDEFYRLVYTTSGLLYGMDNNNKIYQVNDGDASLPAGTVAGQAAELPCSPVTGASLTTGGSADFAFHQNGDLYLISADDIFTINLATCAATFLRDSLATTVSGVAFTDGNKYHVSTFLPTNRKLHVIDDITGTDTAVEVASFTPNVDIYDLASVPKWADVSITKTPSAAEFVAGNTYSYTLATANAGPSNASGPIEVTDTLPTGLTYNSASGTGWTCSANGQDVTCTHAGPMANGGTLPDITLTVDVAIGAAPTATNTACIDTTTIDPDLSNNCDTDVTPAGLPDIATTKVDDDVDNIVNPGQTVQFTITLTNNGDVSGTGIDVDDTLDSNLENIQWISTTCAGAGFANNTVNGSTTLDVDNIDLGIGANCNMVFTADVKAGTPPATIIGNTATVSVTNEGTPGSTPSSDNLTVAAVPSFATTKVDDDVDNIVNPGQTVTYTLTIDNTGNVTGTGIDVDDTMDTNLEDLSVVSLVGCGGSYTDSSTANPPVIDIDDVEVTTATDCVITFTADVIFTTPAGTIIPNTANVSAATEGGSASTPSSDNLTVGGAPSLTATKVDDDVDNIVVPSQTVTYTLTINNVGDVGGTGINVDDTMDTDLENLSVTNIGAGCGGVVTDNSTANPAVLDLDGVQIAAAGSCVITFTADVKAGAAPGATIPNTAVVSPAVEGGPGDSPSSDILTVQGMVSMSSTKVDDDVDNFVMADQTVTYTLTISNAGNVKATAIDVTDVMDADLEDLAVTGFTNCGPNVDNQSSANPPSVDIRDLEVDPGVDCVITFTADVDNTVTGGETIPNTATVTAPAEGGTGSTPSSDVLIVTGPPILDTSTKVDDDVDNIVDPGQTVTYTLTLINTGGTDATGVDVDDNMDTDLENLSVTSIVDCGPLAADNSIANPAALNVDNLEVDVGTNCVITFTADVKLATPGGSTIPNVATVSAANEGGTGSTPSSDILSVSIPVLTTSTKEDDDVDNIVTRGQIVTYTITLKNTGSRTATGVDLDDTVDSDLIDLQNVTVTNCGGSYTDTSDNSPPILDLDDLEIAVGVDCVVTFTAEVKAGALDNATIPNTATYSASNEGSPGGAVISDVLTIPAPPPPAPICGNGVIDGAEQCDDGNNVNGDGCSAICVPEPTGGCTGNCFSPPPPPKSGPKQSSACFIYNPDRPLNFDDLNPFSDTTRFVNALKDTKIIETGDYVFSGNDNHSTGKQQKKYQEGVWNYEPNRNIRRMEAIKTILVSNCIPVDDEILVPDDGFEFRDVPLDTPESDDLLHFTARVYYTAYDEGVITSDLGGLGRPYEDITIGEILSIGLRTTKSMTKEYLNIGGPWYAKYMRYAIDHGILEGISKDPSAHVTRDQFAKIIFRLMAHNPRPKVYKYVEQFEFFEHSHDERGVPINEPKQSFPEEREPLNDQTILRAAANSCFNQNPNRLLTFNDVPANHWASPYVELMRTTQIKSSGDFIESGFGNPTTGNDQNRFSQGEWEYRPGQEATFFDVIRTGLLSNCVAIEETVKRPANGFEYRQLPVATRVTDQAKHFAARVMYTAYKEGIVRGDLHYSEPISRYQAVELLGRAASINLSNYQVRDLPFNDVEGVYRPHVSYLLDKGIVQAGSRFRGNDHLTRAELSKFAALLMLNNPDASISDYAKSVLKAEPSSSGTPVPTLSLTPVPTQESAPEKPETLILRRAAPVNAEPSCLTHEPSRPLTFNDTGGHWARLYVEALKTTKNKNDSQYLVSGVQEGGSTIYNPEENATYIDLVKALLVSNCIDIEEEIPVPADGFEFRELPASISSSDSRYFAARVMYTAYKEGIVRGDLRPFNPVNRVNAMALIDRAALKLNLADTPETVAFSDVNRFIWYAPIVNFLHANGILNGYSDGTFRAQEFLKRGEMAKIITLLMAIHQDDSIRAYGLDLLNYYQIKP